MMLTCFNGLLLVIIVLQWILFTLLLLRHPEALHNVFLSSSSSGNEAANARIVPSSSSSSSKSSQAAMMTILEDDPRIQQERSLDMIDGPPDDGNTTTTTTTPEVILEGVAATIMFRAPRWMHLRYKVMLDNVLSNLPPPSSRSSSRSQDGKQQQQRQHQWKVQVFLNQDWADSAQLWAWHPGLERLLYHDERVILTLLPTNLTMPGSKPKQVVESLWFWNSLAAEHVLLFSANGAMCGNVLSSVWHDLLELDYCGVPWSDLHGVGGDGSSHSLRRRSAMQQIYSMSKSSSRQKGGGSESRHIVATMQDWNRQFEEGVAVDENGADITTTTTTTTKRDLPGRRRRIRPFRIATVNQTVAFGGVHGLADDDHGLLRLPVVVAGTQAHLSYAERDSLLKHCPELKIIFPSLHEPHCFGAHPQADSCKSTICALQEPLPAHGC